MGKIANIIGASGLVGKQLVRLLLENDHFSEVKTFVRRKSGLVHPKLTEHVIDFNQPDEWKELVSGDVLFSTLGTTIKIAKTKENQYKVDFTYQYEFAKAASENNVPAYVLVSSTGANAQSTVFYSKMKGELDDAVQQLGFDKTSIIRPSILDGNRTEKRFGEKAAIIIGGFLTRFILKKYRPIKDVIVAQAMINGFIFQEKEMQIYELEEVFRLAEIE